jgi:plastocyanin
MDSDPTILGADEARALGLSPGAHLHLVTLGGRGSEEHAVPTRIQASPGDAVEFRSVDHRVHTVTFPPDSLSPEILSYLESTSQRSSPPLVFRGSRYIVKLRDAPPGRYPFVSEGHGGKAWGVVEVGSPASTDGS